ncbi:hypothetical protein ACHQM5_018824 [Ranunculus cassubicifolius]
MSQTPAQVAPISPNPTIEHVVLFKLKPDVDQSKVDTLLKGLRNLTSIDGVVHLTAGRVHCLASDSSLDFDIFFHGRYSSKEVLDNFMAHPTHLKLVNELTDPLSEDFMIVNWVAYHDEPLVNPPPGSAIRVTFLKLKKDQKLGGTAKEEVGNHLSESADEATFGENYSSDAKGFSFASLAVFGSVEELEAATDEDIAKHEKLKDLEDYLIVDHIVE